MADITFIETDAKTVYNTVIMRLMEYCNEALYPGDERRVFGEALAALYVAQNSTYNDSMKQSLLRYARGEVLDAIGERLAVERAAPTSAAAVFRFTATAAQASNIIIPEGTRITTDGSVYFATSETAVLQAGETYVEVVGACTEGGAAYNGFTAGQIATLVDLIPYVVAENVTASSGGDDGEPYDEEGDERYRERIRLAPSALSTAGAESSYRFHVLKADADIIDAAIIVPSACVVNVYPLLSGGNLPDDETLEKVAAALGDDVVPMTDRVTVLQPAKVEYTIDVKYYCEAGNEAAVVQAVESAGGAIDKYIEWQHSKLGRAIGPDYLRRCLYEAGATRVEIVSPSFTEIEANEVAALSGSTSISHDTE